MQHHDIIVMGTSAGGIQALSQVLKHMPASLPAAILVVLHQGPDSSTSTLKSILQKSTAFRCLVPRSGAVIKPGIAYLAPANRHMLVVGGKVLLTDGPRENNYRPAIDTLFRSAAVAYGPRVIGVVLTGMLQDGVAGMEAVKRCGGICIVQHPEDAEFASMPQSVLSNMVVDHQVPLDGMSKVLEGFVHQPVGKHPPVPGDLELEARIAQRYLDMNSNYKLMDELGDRMPFSCPSCGGGLWKMKHGRLERYRCHIGHSYTSEMLFKDNKEALEESLWVALRTLEDRKFMLVTSAGHYQQQGQVAQAHEAGKRREEMEKHIYRLRALIKTLNTTTLSENLGGEANGQAME
jgi:two-component system chemotaxis response regulator CheB